jgi:hypothetical protein
VRSGAGAYGAGGEDEGVKGFCSFSLMRRNRRIKADIIGPFAQSGRFPAMSARPTHPAQWRVGGARGVMILMRFISSSKYSI